MARTSRLLTAAVLSTGLAATAATGTVTIGSASAAENDPVVTITVPDKVTGSAYRKRAYVPLGVSAVTGDAGLDIRSTRASYDDPITTTWTSGGRSGSFPAGTQKDFSALDGFAQVVVRNDKGAVVDRKRIDACFNAGGSRAVPEGPATNPYPLGCPYLPLTVGSVQGLPPHWQVPITGEEGGFRTKLSPGRYSLTVSIGQVYADSFELAPEDRVQESTLVIKRESAQEMRRAERERTQRERTQRAGGADTAATLQPGPRPTSRRVGETDGPRPDLRSLPAFDISLNGKGTQMRFAANVWNAGPSPLLVDGFRQGDSDEMDAYQYFFNEAGEQVGYEHIGHMHFHGANHQHWHYEDFARYRLLDADKEPVARSKKVSFCLANTDAVDYTVPGADWHPEGTDLSTACGGPEAQGIREVLASGSGDTYHQFRAGQALPVGDLPNGVYYVSVEANPFGRIMESDETNNVTLRRVRLRGKGTSRTVTVQPFSMVDEDEGSYY